MKTGKKREIFTDYERMYSLTSDLDGQLFLEVVYGGFAMEMLILPLSPEEMSEYEIGGKPALDTLCLKVLKNRESFAVRLRAGE